MNTDQRIEKFVPKYAKSIQGVLAVYEIGLTTIRQECVIFDAWLPHLKQLAEKEMG